MVGFHLHELSTLVIFIETESRMVATRGWGEKELVGCCFISTGVLAVEAGSSSGDGWW